MKTTLRFAALFCIPLSVLTMSTYSKTTKSAAKNVTQDCLLCKGAPEWSSSKSYGNGNYVVYQNRLFRATHFTTGDTPRGFGLYPDGPWLDEGPCY